MAYRDGSGASARWRVVGVYGRVGLGSWKGTVGFVGVGLRRRIRFVIWGWVYALILASGLEQ